MIAHAAKNVTQTNAFAALVVASCASNASAGVQKSFSIFLSERQCITRIIKTYESSFFQEILLRLSLWNQMIRKDHHENIINK